eukprot:13930358-Heterocapsa_arctica.AAC.1
MLVEDLRPHRGEVGHRQSIQRNVGDAPPSPAERRDGKGLPVDRGGPVQVLDESRGAFRGLLDGLVQPPAQFPRANIKPIETSGREHCQNVGARQ